MECGDATLVGFALVCGSKMQHISKQTPDKKMAWKAKLQTSSASICCRGPYHFLEVSLISAKRLLDFGAKLKTHSLPPEKKEKNRTPPSEVLDSFRPQSWGPSSGVVVFSVTAGLRNYNSNSFIEGGTESMLQMVSIWFNVVPLLLSRFISM